MNSPIVGCSVKPCVPAPTEMTIMVAELYKLRAQKDGRKMTGFMIGVVINMAELDKLCMCLHVGVLACAIARVRECQVNGVPKATALCAHDPKQLRCVHMIPKQLRCVHMLPA